MILNLIIELNNALNTIAAILIVRTIILFLISKWKQYRNFSFTWKVLLSIITLFLRYSDG